MTSYSGAPLEHNSGPVCYRCWQEGCECHWCDGCGVPMHPLDGYVCGECLPGGEISGTRQPRGTLQHPAVAESQSEPSRTPESLGNFYVEVE